MPSRSNVAMLMHPASVGSFGGVVVLHAQAPSFGGVVAKFCGGSTAPPPLVMEPVGGYP